LPSSSVIDSMYDCSDIGMICVLTNVFSVASLVMYDLSYTSSKVCVWYTLLSSLLGMLHSKAILFCPGVSSTGSEYTGSPSATSVTVPYTGISASLVRYAVDILFQNY